MSLSQTQIIRSLADALSWLEKEVAWGVSPSNLGHLTGRIGELYTAMVTRGQMALAVNQQGYDVVSAEGEHISVKTVTSSSHVSFNASTFAAVDRIMVLRINVDEGDISIEEILDCSAVEAKEKMRVDSDGFTFPINRSARKFRDLHDLKVIAEPAYDNHRIIQYENGTIIVQTNNVQVSAAKPVLREIAAAVGVNTLNSNGNPKNTRTLGADIVRLLKEVRAPNEGA